MKAKPPDTRADNYLRLCIVECPNPADAMESRREAPAISEIASLIGHTVLQQTVISLTGLTEACEYISSICHIEGVDLTIPLCLHIAAHGGDDGIQVGRKSVDWEVLLKAIRPVFTNRYEGRRVLVLSACMADQQQLTHGFESAVKAKRKLSPPHYVFCATGKVGWSQAVVGWTLLYHLIPQVNLDKRSDVRRMLEKIYAVTGHAFQYFRWVENERCYKSWLPKNLE